MKNNKNTIHYCYYQEERPYKGTCPVTTCKAHTNRHDSGCVFNVLQKKDIGVPELTYIWNIEPEVLEERFNKGLSNIKQVILLQRALEWVRSLSFSSPYSTKGDPVLEVIKNRYPFNIPELFTTENDIVRLILNHKTIEKKFELELPIKKYEIVKITNKYHQEAALT